MSVIPRGCFSNFFLAPTLEQTSFTVDDGDGSVQLCVHFGGEELNITATLDTYGSATSKPEITWVHLKLYILQYRFQMGLSVNDSQLCKKY